MGAVESGCSDMSDMNLIFIALNVVFVTLDLGSAYHVPKRIPSHINGIAISSNKGIDHHRPHPVFPVPSWSVGAGDDDATQSVCDVNTNLWECLGSDRDWGLVTVQDKTGEERLQSVPRLLARTALLVISAQKTAESLHKILENHHQRRILAENNDGGVSVLIQGELDSSNKIFEAVTTEFVAENMMSNRFNSSSREALLKAASTIVNGDILELGTTEAATKLLHQVVLKANENEKDDKKKRMLVTSDSSSDWLQNHSDLLCSFHQFVFVPLYNNGAGCQSPNQAAAAKKGRSANRKKRITCMHLQA